MTQWSAGMKRCKEIAMLCQNCGDKIGNLEKPRTYRGDQVCQDCHRKLHAGGGAYPAIMTIIGFGLFIYGYFTMQQDGSAYASQFTLPAMIVGATWSLASLAWFIIHRIRHS